jgi:prolyl oligopeptidase
MSRHVCIASLAIGLNLMLSAQPPATPKRPVTSAYHGVKVLEDYRWLEDYSAPEVRAWSDAQNQYARKYLDALPFRAPLADQLRRLLSHPSPAYFNLAREKGLVFAIKRQPPKEQPLLVTLASPDDLASERVVIDPAAIDPSGHTAIDFYVPSKDARLVAVSLSQGGSESGDVHVYETATGKALPDVIPRVNGGTAGGSVAWNHDGTGFWYTRYPRAGERPAADLDFYQQVWFHRLGTPTAEDVYSLGKDFPRVAEIQLASSDDGRSVLARMANGDGGEFAHYLLAPGKDWVRIAGLADQVIQSAFGPDGAVYLLSRRGAPRGQILRYPGMHLLIPQSELTLQNILPTAYHLYVESLDGGPSRLRVFDLKGAALGDVPIAPVSTVTELLRLNGDEILFGNVTWLKPLAWFHYDPATKKITPSALKETSAANYDDIEIERVFATSKDGTRVPLNVLRPKTTKLDGSNPVLLTAYGGYGISLTPGFSARLRPLFDSGFVYVIANLRGGGEYGEEWHLAGNLTRKQNVFDDFAAVARYLIDKKYTNPSKLAIEGGSNGGLLMGAALTQHPELFRAVVAHVGIYDMLRVELSPNGAFNVTEFGTVKEADLFRALYAYSPYHHVVDGTQYPAVLFLTGDNDPRVDPANSRKMTARLQAGGTRLPVLLRTSGTSGHGFGTALSERIAQTADVFAFLFDQLSLR